MFSTGRRFDSPRLSSLVPGPGTYESKSCFEPPLSPEVSYIGCRESADWLFEVSPSRRARGENSGGSPPSKGALSRSVTQLEQSLRLSRTPSSLWSMSTSDRDSWIVHTMDRTGKVLVRRGGEDLRTSCARGPGIYYDPLRERELNTSCVKSHNFRGKCEEATALWHRSAYSHKYRGARPTAHSVLSFSGGWSNPPLPRSFNRSSFTDYSWQSLLAGARESIHASGRLLGEEHRWHAHGNSHTDLQRFGLSKGYAADQANADRSHSPFEVLLAGSRTDVADALRDIVDVSPPGSGAGTPKAPRRPLFFLDEGSIPDEGSALSVEATPEHSENLWQSLV
ncbi:hypothetical protein FOZ60_000139 [Perkinsus olseni]|uniref:Uncharacterized protein n=1 Tax=Perkinsus olseni TaxID=32597 RepID=A0A7J6PNY9_PEROL|nr:hypothetical protein FOZ60_000139 [Perkinsus olseni]